MRRALSFWLLGIVASVLASGSTAQRGAAAEWSIQLTAERACTECPGGRSFLFNCRHLKKGTTFSFTLMNLAKRITSADVYGARAVIIGELPQLGNVVTVYDLNARTVLDECYGYAAALSSQKRYVAFKRFYPRFAPEALKSDVLLLYDVAASPRSNRVAGQRDAISPENGGIPVFPGHNAVGRTMEPSPEDKYSIHAPFAWSTDDSLLAFLAEREGSGSIAVVARLSGGLTEVSVCARAVGGKEALIDSAARPEQPMRLVPQALEFDPKGLLRIRPYPVENVKPGFTLDVLGACEERFSSKESGH